MEPNPIIDLDRAANPTLAGDVLAAAVDLGASCIRIAPGRPPTARIDGSLLALGRATWGADAVAAFCRSVRSDGHRAEPEEVEAADFGFVHRTGERFRVRILRRQGGVVAVLRRARR
jgi:twitching motility protein PilT